MKKEISLSEKGSVAVEACPRKTLFAALLEQGVVLEAGCNGKGRCGRCRVRYLTAAPLPAATERRFFSAQELREGMRLACLHPVSRSCQVETAYLQPPKVEIVSETPLIEPQQDVSEGDWCIAVDLGTTTIAMQARRLSDGQVLGTWKGMNPQRQFGSDVVSRMQAAQEGQDGALRTCVQAALRTGICSLLREVQDNPKGIYLAGNTVMEHLLAGLSVKGLSRHPFTPVTLAEQTVVLDPAPPFLSLTLLPGLSNFVGADLLAGVLACGMHRREKVSLLIDLGTNGELVLGNQDRLLCTATAAGPAFEGGPGNMAPGTDMIAVIAELMDAGVVDETGLMAEPWFERGIEWVTGVGEKRGEGRSLFMTQAQIRAVQMAKSAIYAGICILIKEYGISLEEIDEVYLAGGFGYYLDVEKAARIGLFPDELKGKTEAVGNTSLSGAYLYGRNTAKEEAVRIKGICRAINLAEHPDFEAIYLEHLNLE